MDSVERAKYKQLANDSIIATFGRDDNEARLAQALEKAIDHIEYLRAEWRPACEDCDIRGKTYDEAEEDGEI